MKRRGNHSPRSFFRPVKQRTEVAVVRRSLSVWLGAWSRAHGGPCSLRQAQRAPTHGAESHQRLRGFPQPNLTAALMSLLRDFQLPYNPVNLSRLDAGLEIAVQARHGMRFAFEELSNSGVRMS
jgi:hypothetical protein